VIYLYTHLGVRWNDSSLLDEARECAHILAGHIENEQMSPFFKSTPHSLLLFYHS